MERPCHFIRFNYFVLVTLVLLQASCSVPSKEDNAVIKFSETEYDFGSLQQKNQVTHCFEFFNRGETALVINDVKTSCGCTAVQWPKEPVRPKKSGIISVGYDAAFPGVFHKEITVYYNGPGSPFVLKIRGEVYFPGELQAEKQ